MIRLACWARTLNLYTSLLSLHAQHSTHHPLALMPCRPTPNLLHWKMERQRNTLAADGGHLHRVLTWLLAGAAVTSMATYAWLALQHQQQSGQCVSFPGSWWHARRRRRNQQQYVQGVLGLIGNTPLVKIESLSRETGCLILGKAEFLNPGGSVKDRVALHIVREALQEGRLCPGGLITEGTAGSTGVSLAMVAAACGCRCFIAMPDDAAIEKANILQAMGAEVQRVRPVSITNPGHHVNVARRRAEAEPAGTALFADQFDNLANFRAHWDTGREIWEQSGGHLHAFVSGAGTGGTIAGVARYLKQQNPAIQVFLVDPPGSSLYNKVVRGVLYTREEAEGKRLRNPFDTITEGIGLNRLTHNFNQGLPHIDGAFKGTDKEAVEMAAYLLRNDGLFVGSSAAMNCVGAVKAARKLGPGHIIVTVLCDGGARHLSKFHSAEYLAQQGLTPVGTGTHLDFVTC